MQEEDEGEQMPFKLQSRSVEQVAAAREEVDDAMVVVVARADKPIIGMRMRWRCMLKQVLVVGVK